MFDFIPSPLPNIACSRLRRACREPYRSPHKRHSSILNLPRFRRHPESYESAVGVCHGEAKRPVFTKAYKAEVVELVRKGGKSAWRNGGVRRRGP